jgi:hypothetical protein
MSDDSFDDGLVHSHGWSAAPQRPQAASYPIADASAARTPSTAAHDDHVYCD